jgi:hypothetical protein
MKRYLVVGLAKTGTTVISKTVQNSANIKDYFLEPKHAGFFEHLANGNGDGVVKIIFDHWADRPRLLNSIVHNEMKTGFLANIFITRDPRAELISRINYVAFPFFHAQKRSTKDADDWIDLFRRKETDPSFSLRDLVGAMKDRFNVRITEGAPKMTEAYARYIASIPEHLKVLVRYEDFVSSNLASHPLAHLFSGNRDVGNDLQRTRRSGGAEDWKAFVNADDVKWLNDHLASPLNALGYDLKVDTSDEIDPQNCSLYVTRIIEEAMTSYRSTS